MAEMIKINEKDAYYVVDGVKYAPTFPEEWANNHIEGTCPKNCNNCECFGKWRGVFIGYCANCADYEYHYMRGYGFIDIGKEIDADLPESAMQTYLKNVDLKEMPYVEEEESYEDFDK
jgi:hypothetical protein